MTDAPTSRDPVWKMEMTGGTSATTTVTNHVAAGGGNEYRQILLTEECFLKNEFEKRNLGHTARLTKNRPDECS